MNSLSPHLRGLRRSLQYLTAKILKVLSTISGSMLASADEAASCYREITVNVVVLEGLGNAGGLWGIVRVEPQP
jgi:hypothetical protein